MAILVAPIVHPLTEYRMMLFDADSTLRRCTVPGQPCPNADGEWELMPNVTETLGKYHWSFVDFSGGMFPGICTNQGGVDSGFLSKESCDAMLYQLWCACFFPDLTYSAEHNIHVCYHTPQAGCLCRKPAPLLLYEAMNVALKTWRRRHDPFADLFTRDVLYVGDMPSDLEAAQRAGVDFSWAATFFGWLEAGDVAP